MPYLIKECHIMGCSMTPLARWIVASHFYHKVLTMEAIENMKYNGTKLHGDLAKLLVRHICME